MHSNFQDRETDEHCRDRDGKKIGPGSPERRLLVKKPFVPVLNSYILLYVTYNMLQKATENVVLPFLGMFMKSTTMSQNHKFPRGNSEANRASKTQDKSKPFD